MRSNGCAEEGIKGFLHVCTSVRLSKVLLENWNSNNVPLICHLR